MAEADRPVKRLRTSKASRPGIPEFTPDGSAVANFYRTFKAGMNAMLDAGQFMNCDHNCQIVGDLLMARINHTEIKGQQKYSMWCTRDVEDASIPTTGKRTEVYLNHEWTPNLAMLDTWIATHLNTDEKRAKFCPFLTLVSIASKTRDSILWQDNKMLNDIGLPTWADVFTRGKNIKNKYKNSRRLAIGPVCHLHAAFQTVERYRTQRPNSAKALKPDGFRRIMHSYHTVLYTQLVSAGQRQILHEIFKDNNWDNLPLLVASMTVIKPHIEHYWCLTPEFIYHLEDADYNGADMCSEWPYKIVEKLMPKIQIHAPNHLWAARLKQVKIHQVFGTATEDLNIVSAMWGENFEMRAQWDRYPNKSPHVLIANSGIKYNFWAKPQKGAPINVGIQRAPQINTVPVFRGQRENRFHGKSLEDLTKGMGSGQYDTVKEQLKAEYEMYKNEEKECTGYFYPRNWKVGDAPYDVNFPERPKLFYGNPSVGNVRDDEMEH